MNEQKRDALSEALREHAWTWPDSFCACGAHMEYSTWGVHYADALLPLVDTWLAEAEQRVTGAVEAALRLIAPDHITPMGARQVKKAMEKAEGER